MFLYFAWEFELIKWLQEHSNKITDFFFNAASLFGEEIILIMVVAVVYWCISKRRGEYIAFSLMTSIALNAILKNIFLAKRPFEYEGYGIINKRPATATGTSFPSGHTQSASTAFTSLYLAFKKKWMLYFAIIITILVALSRINLGVHFVTDVVVGGILGVVFAIGAYKLFKTFEKQKFLIYLIIILFLIPVLIIIDDKAIYMGAGLYIGYVSGIFVENKYINFTTESTLLEKIIRVLLGVVLLFGLKEGLKLIFPEQNLFHMIRYGLISFVGIGLYPVTFKYINKGLLKMSKREV